MHRKRTTPTTATTAATGRPVSGPAGAVSASPHGPRHSAEHGRTHLEWISDRISGVLDPLAERCRGWPADTIRPVLAQAWRRGFGGELGEPGLSDTAAALRDGRPWSEALWTDGW